MHRDIEWYVGAGMETRDFNGLPEPWRIALQDPYLSGFLSALEAVAGAASTRPRGHQVLVVCDRTKFRGRVLDIYAMGQQRQRNGERLADTLAFSMRHDSVRLHAAEVVAWEYRLELERRYGHRDQPIRKSWQRLLDKHITMGDLFRLVTPGVAAQWFRFGI